MANYSLLCVLLFAVLSVSHAQFQSPFNGSFEVRTNVKPICDTSACGCCPFGVISSLQIASTSSSATLRITLRFGTNCLYTTYTTTEVVSAATPYSFNVVLVGLTGQVTLSGDGTTVTFKNFVAPLCQFNAVRTNRPQFQSPFTGNFEVRTNVQPTCDTTACVCCPFGLISSTQIASTLSSATLRITVRFGTNCPDTTYTTTQIVRAATPYWFDFVLQGQRGQVTLSGDNTTLSFRNIDSPLCQFTAVRTTGRSAQGTSKPVTTAMFLGLALKLVCTFLFA